MAKIVTAHNEDYLVIGEDDKLFDNFGFDVNYEIDNVDFINRYSEPYRGELGYYSFKINNLWGLNGIDDVNDGDFANDDWTIYVYDGSEEELFLASTKYFIKCSDIKNGNITNIVPSMEDFTKGVACALDILYDNIDVEFEFDISAELNSFDFNIRKFNYEMPSIEKLQELLEKISGDE